MRWRRMPMEAESPEEYGYERIRSNLAESSCRDRTFADLGVRLDDLVLLYGDHRGLPELRRIVGVEAGLGPEAVLTAAGAAMALFLVHVVLLGPDSHLVVTAPNYATNLETPFAIGGPVEDTSPEIWARMWDANFRSALNVCRAVVPAMKRQGGGTIVNVGSRASLGAGADVSAYAIAKTAVLRLTESLAAEGKRDGVRVNCVLPDAIAPPAGGPGTPAEAIADVLVYLASDAARAITGAAVPV